MRCQEYERRWADHYPCQCLGTWHRVKMKGAPPEDRRLCSYHRKELRRRGYKVYKLRKPPNNV